MKQTALNQLATVSAGQGAPKDNEFSDSGIPFVRAGSLDGLLSGKSESGLELVSDETAKLRKLKTYPKGTILFAKSGISATKDRIYVLQNPAYVVSHLATLIPNGNAHADYLRLALKNFPPSVLIKDLAYPAISLGDIQSYEIPVPEQLDDQIRIAHLLGKVEGLIAQRKQHLQQLDDLLKSVFLEMFGDPVRNEKGWSVLPLQSVTSKIGSGATPTGGNEAYKTEGISLIRSMNVHDGKFVYKDLAFIDDIQASKLRNVVVEGDDVLLNITGASVCRCAIVPNGILPARVNQHVAILRPKPGEINSKYLAACLISDSYKNLLLKIARINGATREALTKDQLEKLLICKPPIVHQNQFATIVEKVVGIKSLYQKSLTDLETLYGALSQQAFKGELDLSRVPLPGVQPEEETVVVTEPMHAPAEEGLAINLPDIGTLPDALGSTEARAAFISQWLEAYRVQLGDTPFSIQHFLATAQTRLAELHPNNDFALGANNYEHIKTWMFEALATGRLTQAFDAAGNRIELKAAFEKSSA